MNICGMYKQRLMPWLHILKRKELPISEIMMPLLEEARKEGAFVYHSFPDYLTSNNSIRYYPLAKIIANEDHACHIFLGADESGNPVVLKLGNPWICDFDYVELERNALTTVGQSPHRHIIPLMDSGGYTVEIENKRGELVNRTRQFLVLQYLEGETFHATIENRLISKLAKIKAVTQICDAIAAIHRSGIVHRDVKTRNIMLLQPINEDHIRAVLFDFDRSIILSPGELDFRNVGPTTHWYNAPETLKENIRHMPWCDHRVDIYSLGVVLFEALTRRQQPTGNPEPKSMHHIIRSGQTPKEVRNIVIQATQLDPKDRFQTAGEMRRALEEVLANDMICSEFATIY